MKRIIALFLILVSVFVLAACESAPKPEPTPEPTPEATPEPTEKPLSVNTGEILEVNDNGETLVVKVKVSSLANNKQTITQNYYNACELIRTYSGTSTKLDYWAVADMADGSEGKIIAFVVPADVFNTIKTQQFPDNMLSDYVTDLWILPSLQK